MKIPCDQRHAEMSRSLESLQQNHTNFLQNGGNIKRAKFYFNVIGETFFNVPISQVRTTCKKKHTYKHHLSHRDVLLIHISQQQKK